MRAIREYADSIHPYRDGHSSERVLDAVDEFIAAPVPAIASRNRATGGVRSKIRKRLGYWGPA